VAYLHIGKGTGIEVGLDWFEIDPVSIFEGVEDVGEGLLGSLDHTIQMLYYSLGMELVWVCVLSLVALEVLPLILQQCLLLEAGSLLQDSSKTADILGHPLDLEHFLPLQVHVLLAEPLLIGLPDINSPQQIRHLLLDLFQIELVKLVCVFGAELEVVLAGLVDTIKGHEYEVEIQRGGDCIAQVKGNKFCLGFFCFGEELDLTESAAFVLGADQSDVSQQAGPPCLEQVD
jgi:hypothetical protein